MSSAPGSSAAMALLDKYSKLNRCIDDTRNEISQLQDQVESVRSQMQISQQQRCDYKEQLSTAQHETADLALEIQLLEEQQTKLHTRVSAASNVLEEAHFKQKSMATFIQEQRVSFLNSCTEFRIECKRMRLGALTSNYYHKDDLTEAFLETNRIPRHLDSGDRDEPLDDRTYAKDMEIEQEGERMKCNKKSLAEAKHRLQRAHVEHGTFLNRASLRKKQMEQQRSQLVRVKKSVTDLEQELGDIMRITRRAQDKARNLEKGIPGGKQQRIVSIANSQQNQSASTVTPSTSRTATPARYSSVTPSPPLPSRAGTKTAADVRNSNRAYYNNPYAKKPSQKGNDIVNPYNKSVGNNLSQGDDVVRHPYAAVTIAETKSWTSAVERQHPHRAGRIRVDRQFSTTLEISSTKEEEASSGISASSSMQKVQSLKLVLNDNETQSSDESSTSSVQYSTIGKTTCLEDDDDDDDDAELLSYVAFSRTK